MDQHQKALRIGAAVIACSILFRLLGSGFFTPLVSLLQHPQAVALLMYLETGRVSRFAEAEEKSDWTAESPPPDTVAAEPTVPDIQAVFGVQDLELVEIRNQGTWEPDLEELLTAPVALELKQEAPTVLILHTHATESYTKTGDQDYVESSAYRTLDENYNLLRVGDALAQKLEAAGITVLHDRTLHDYPSYSGSYNHSRASAEKYLEEYPSIQLILDIHRDAGQTDDGRQLSTGASQGGVDAAQLMLVMATGENGLYHPNWQQNLSLALKLHVQLERLFPGITRPLILRGARYNQDLHPNMLLVEVGASGDTLAEALNAMDPLAQAIISLSEQEGE